MNVNTNEGSIRLTTSDGKRFTISESEASCSTVLLNMMSVSRPFVNRSGQRELITLPCVKSETLEKILEWHRIHCKDHTTTRDQDEGNDNFSSKKLDLTRWENDFLESLPENELLILMHAANYLNIQSLLGACCQYLAQQWEGRKVEDIRKMYNIPNDIPPEEERLMSQDSRRLGLPE